MKSKRFRKGVSVLLSAAMAASCLTTGLTTLAAGHDLVLPQGEQALGKAQPRFPGYRVEDIKNWNAETDPFSDMVRARVPLQQRNEQFQATQANPTLTDDAKVMLMQTDYNGTPFDNMLYNNDFSQYVFNYWQYTDMFSPWHGAATAATPSSFFGMNFEYGTINIPNAAYTNAAHKNGVKSIACMYFDAGNRKGQTIRELLEKDDEGNYIVVNKLAEIAEYYGFDGYFFNQEEFPGDQKVLRAALQELLGQMTARGLYTQYYTAGLRNITKQYEPWLRNADGEMVCNSIFTDYVIGSWKWPNVDDSVKFCNQQGYSIYDVGFYGLECNLGGVNAHPGDGAFIEGTRNLKASIALFTPSDYYLRKLTFNDDNPNLPAFQQNRFQWMVADRERIFFSGAKHDPTDTEFEGTVDWSKVGYSNVSARGVAQYTSSRSVIDGSAFYSNFNTGKGMQYFVDGAVSRDEEWSNINIQDILPSWQWWMESEGQKLGVDFDYGVKEERADLNSQRISTPYTQVGAYNGGSSLVVYGDIDAENFLHLYKTDLQVKEGSKFSITYNKVSATDSSAMEIGVIFKNAPDTVVTFTVPNSGKQTDGWVTKQISIPEDYAGEEIAAIGLAFKDGKNGVKDYQMNIGEIKLTDGTNHTPDAPTGLSIRAAYDTKEMILDWDLADFDTVDKYNVYANMSDGSRICLGGVYDGVYYVKNTMADGIVTMEVTAVGKDGSESEPATVEFSYSENVSNVKVEESLDANGLTMQAANAGYLDVSFTKPNVDYKELRLDFKSVYAADDTSYSMTVGSDADSARFYISRGHGESYDLYITTVFEDGSESEPIAYRGRLRDVWSQPLEEKDVTIADNKISFNPPASVDWYKIYAYADGEKFYEGVRGVDYIYFETEIPEGANAVDVVLEDYFGNLSDPYSIAVSRYSTATGKIDEASVPDDALRQAIIEQIGSDSASAVDAYTGVLDLTGLDIHDLTGLKLVARAQNIILSETPIERIGKDTFGVYVQKVDLSDCSDLKIVHRSAFAGAKKLREVDITGCSALQVLEIVNSSVEKLIYGDAAAFPELMRLDLSGSRFEMSEGTAEYAFAAQIATQTSEDKAFETYDPDVEINMALNAAIVEDQTTVDLKTAKKLVDGKFSWIELYDPPVTFTIDLGQPRLITSWILYNDSNYYGFQDFTISASNDGVNYEEIVNVAGNSIKQISGKIANPQEYRYYQLTGTAFFEDGGDLKELELYGYQKITYTSEVKFDNQRPRFVTNGVNTNVTLNRKNGQVLDLQGILADAIAQANAQCFTVNGSAPAELEGAQWLDPEYTLAPETEDKEKEIHLIQTVDAKGDTSYAKSIDGSVDGVYTVKYITLDSNNMEGETLYTFTVNVKGVTAVLEKVIEAAEQLVKDGALNGTMEAVVNEFNAALEEAKTIVAKEDASQAEINASTLRLLSAMAKVDWKQGDKTVLEIAVEVAGSIESNLSLYVEAGKQEFVDALAEARAILESGNAWQDDIDASVTRLVEAMSAMRMAANKDILNEMIGKAQSINLSAYTAASANAVRAALANAEAVAADANAAQNDVDAAANTLKAALGGLVVVNGDGNNGNTNAGSNVPMGDGSAPTQTGDSGAASLAMLALFSAGAVVLLKKKQK